MCDNIINKKYSVGIQNIISNHENQLVCTAQETSNKCRDIQKPEKRKKKKKKDIKYTKNPKIPTQILKRLKLISHAAHSKTSKPQAWESRSNLGKSDDP